jgi:hypothetical protein
MTAHIGGPCPLCGKAFPNNLGLHYHLKWHMTKGDMPTVEPRLPDKPPRPRIQMSDLWETATKQASENNPQNMP